jgi:hypothetical protein
MSELSVVTLGHVHAEAFEALAPHLTRLEQVMTNLNPRVRLADARAELNRAVDAAAHDWIVVLRERELIDAALAAEIAASMSAADAWGFRIRVVPLYAGRPLRAGVDPGELRLFHRRHLLRRGEPGVQGTVVRLRNPIWGRTFGSTEEHRQYLERHGVPHSALRRALLFLRNARTLDRNTLRYLWIEAGFDKS